MGWATDLQQASFRGIEFDCLSTNDMVSNTLAVKQPPYASSAIIEHMGTEPRKISLKIVLSGNDYKLYLDSLETAFQMTGAGELIHPVFGIKTVSVASFAVVHDTETVDGCHIDVDFLVAKAEKKALFVPIRLPEEVNYALVIAPSAEALQAQLEQLEEADPNRFLSAIQTIRNGLQKARQILGIVRSTLDNILSPSEWAVGLVDDVSRLVNFDVTNISAISKWRSLVNRVQRIGSVFDGESDANHIVNHPSFKQLVRAITTAAVIATAQSVIKNVRREMADNNNNASITPPELAVIRQQVRQDIQSAIIAERATTPEQSNIGNIDPAAQVAIYKTVADQIHQQIQALIEIRPPIVNSIIILPCTTHWLAHQLYGDMSRSNELKRLNPTLQNPAVLQIGTELTAYAR